jgi:hypothetical protein
MAEKTGTTGINEELAMFLKNNFKINLTNSHVLVNVGCMGKVYDELRKAIRASTKTRYRLWQETGIDQALLVRFMAGKSGLSVESIEKLIKALGLEIIIQIKTTNKQEAKYGKCD